MARQQNRDVIVTRPISAGTSTHYSPGERISGDGQVLARLVGMRKARWATDGDTEIGPPEVLAARSTRNGKPARAHDG